MVSKKRDDDGVNKDRPARWKSKGRMEGGIGLVEKKLELRAPGVTWGASSSQTAAQVHCQLKITPLLLFLSADSIWILFLFSLMVYDMSGRLQLKVCRAMLCTKTSLASTYSSYGPRERVLMQEVHNPMYLHVPILPNPNIRANVSPIYHPS